MNNIPVRVQTTNRAYQRDTHSKGLINTDITGLLHNRSMRSRTRSHHSELESLRQQVARLTAIIETHIGIKV
jgi:hypothetical protein